MERDHYEAGHEGNDSNAGTNEKDNFISAEFLYLYYTSHNMALPRIWCHLSGHAGYRDQAAVISTFPPDAHAAALNSILLLLPYEVEPQMSCPLQSSHHHLQTGADGIRQLVWCQQLLTCFTFLLASVSSPNITSLQIISWWCNYWTTPFFVFQNILVHPVPKGS